MIKSKTIKRLQQDKKRADEASNILLVSSKPSPGVGGDLTEFGEDEYVSVQEREESVTRTIFLAPNPTVRSTFTTRAQSRAYRATEGRPECKGLEICTHNHERSQGIVNRVERDDEGREGLKREQQ